MTVRWLKKMGFDRSSYDRSTRSYILGCSGCQAFYSKLPEDRWPVIPTHQPGCPNFVATEETEETEHIPTWQAAVEVLAETGNDAVMLGDTGLLDAIASRAGLKDSGTPMERWKRVLDNLSRCPGPFVAKLTHDGRSFVRVFRLPVESDEGTTKSQAS